MGINRAQLFWISLYFALLLICGSMLILSDLLSLRARDAIIPIAADGFKLVLGATVGAISAVLGVKSTG